MTLILHVDADCFYVSCERVRYPHLIGEPVGVLGNQGACVIARSYELKKKGVTVGMPIWEAKKLCHDAIFIKRDFLWYEVLSLEMQKILKSYGEDLEFYSIDESFMNLEGTKIQPCNGKKVSQESLYSFGKDLQMQMLSKVKVHFIMSPSPLDLSLTASVL